MSAEVHTSSLYLGGTIQERTRSLLGWTDQNSPAMQSDSHMRLCKRASASYPNFRQTPYVIPAWRSRKNSISSNCSSVSSDYSQPSPSNSARSYDSLSPEPTPVGKENWITAQKTSRSAEREARVFERLRQLLPVLPTDRNAYRALIDTVSQVMDLERQLELLNEEAEGMRNRLRIAEHDEFAVPDDLESVDVTDFKHLMCTSPTNSSLSYENISFEALEDIE